MNAFQRVAPSAPRLGTGKAAAAAGETGETR